MKKNAGLKQPNEALVVRAHVLYAWRFFIFVFYKNIFSIWKFTGIYPGRPAAGRQSISEKNFAEKIARRSLGAGRPAAGRPAPQAARL